MNISKQLNAISPLDGRYSLYVDILRPLLSEAAFMAHRVEVEVAWLINLADSNLPGLKSFSDKSKEKLNYLVKNFSLEDAEKIKSIEKITNHDVKAVEYWLKDKITNSGNKELIDAIEFIHFACTSEDINNVSYALMLSRTRDNVILPIIEKLTDKIASIAELHSSQPMLSRTHGQPASPTTVGKELANVVVRLYHAIEKIKDVTILAKLNGATGNYNAHIATYPNIDWKLLTKNIILKLGLTQNTHTTQIEPHDWIAELFDSISRVNTIILDLDRDIWGYISLGYFKQIPKEGEIGSSTMPHKINPIDFENSEGNIGIANSLLRHMSDKLPVSRWQRDLTDSTVLRNIGVAIGYCIIAWEACLRGLNKLSINKESIDNDLNNSWEVLAEPIQTVMRRYGIEKPYEQLKELTRGKKINKDDLYIFITNLNIPSEAKEYLISLEPRSYIGLSEELALSLNEVKSIK
ncbi:adenylosuccinate lyase [Candidatus Kinetoplastibacterium oncopeltii TCC290E]|uniref:Adenylosuccinate lyase n=1 Tax=Candidatus Kinetoplastidibacterium stringomonadis TCC290E TaxID=1208920 RepID=M1M8N1_9PROT|nr:adenylosuccinate lyase [Candidatus Kinetoplastibacterium oncopeltii]AGF48355.1 adenylosuccinate lyase [Candidatus Kinetoplastibacterium oncopeltii TCC290E]